MSSSKFKKMMREIKRKEQEKAIKKGIRRGYKPSAAQLEALARARAARGRGYYKEARESVQTYEPGDLWTDAIVDGTGRFSHYSSNIVDTYGNEATRRVGMFSRALRDYIE